jgi:hypothetical protein
LRINLLADRDGDEAIDSPNRECWHVACFHLGRFRGAALCTLHRFLPFQSPALGYARGEARCVIVMGAKLFSV